MLHATPKPSQHTDSHPHYSIDSHHHSDYYYHIFSRKDRAIGTINWAFLQVYIRLYDREHIGDLEKPEHSRDAFIREEHHRRATDEVAKGNSRRTHQTPMQVYIALAQALDGMIGYATYPETQQQQTQFKETPDRDTDPNLPITERAE